MDYSVPLQFGSKQVTGENGGPGGLFHSLRVIPPILDICEDVMRLCPKAFFINFSNPMSRICLAIKRKFPLLKFVGLCHEYHHFKVHFERILNRNLSELLIRAGGLNHFGVVLEIKDKKTGQDLYPVIRKRGVPYLKSLENLDTDLIAFILENFGYIPYTPDSHFGEYIQWAWEIADISGIRTFWRNYRDYTLGAGKRLKKLIKRGKGGRLVKKDDERAIPIIEGILTDANYLEASVNIPNDNIFSNLPKDLVVECPAKVNKDGLKGLKLGEYPKSLAALLRNQASVQDLVVETVFKGSKESALNALLADPVVTSVFQARKILDEMLKLQSNYIDLK
jgi:alpha-galactosidase